MSTVMEGGSGGPRRVILATFGSLGDLNPFVALARGLQARGLHPVLATSEQHRDRVEREGVEFQPVRPTLTGLENDPEVFRRAMDAREGPSYVIKKLFMPHVREGVEDLRALAEGADAMVAHSIVFAAPIVAELTRVPWVTVGIAPMVFMSKYDPPVVPTLPAMRHLRPLGPRFWGPLLSIAKRTVRSWSDPVRALRAELGLSPGGDPIFEGAYSPELVLAVFSEAFGPPQPDWPANTVQTGFLHHDRIDGRGLDPDLASFLDAGTPPIVFTLGSSAVMTAGDFYAQGLAAALKLGRRAVLLVGRDDRNRPEGPIPDGVFVAEYVPYSELLPRAAAVVHQGGVGTTAQALRAGVPALVVPFSHDQYDNADRVARLRAGGMLFRNRYNAGTAAKALAKLLDDPEVIAGSAEVGRRLRAEDGVAAACDAIESFMAGKRGRSNAGAR